jgi:hypothetical protein
MFIPIRELEGLNIGVRITVFDGESPDALAQG